MNSSEFVQTQWIVEFNSLFERGDKYFWLPFFGLEHIHYTVETLDLIYDIWCRTQF